jgi:hypothetical protein
MTSVSGKYRSLRKPLHISTSLFRAPPESTSAYGDSSLGNTEREVVSYCLKSGYGTRLIPAGAVTGAHFVKTPTYVQITGTLASGVMNIVPGDAGGELDPHGAG